MSRQIGQFTRVKWDPEEQKRIRTIMSETGLKNTTEVIRLSVMNEFKRLTGTPDPSNLE